MTPGLILCGVILAAFYVFLFLRDNSAPVVDPTGFKRDPGHGFLYRVERCWSSDKKIAVRGWLVRERHGTSRRSVRVLALDSTGRLHALKTTLRQRDDVNALIARSLGDGVAYRNAGFVASLDLATANARFDPEHLYLAYDDGEERVLLPARCEAEQSS